MRLSYQGLCPNSISRGIGARHVQRPSVRSTVSSEQRSARARRRVLRGDAELAQHDLARRRRAEAVDAHDVVGVALPAEAHAGLDRERRHAGRQHVDAVRRSDCCSNRSHDGIDTTRTDDALRVAEQLARRDAHLHLGAGADEHEVEVGRRLRRRARTRRAGTPTGARSAVPSSTGTFWRVRISAVGPSPSRCTRHAAATSLASAGRMTRSPGIARSDASCSIGWWVGPSSPTPTESCVQTKQTLVCMIDSEPHRGPHVVAEHEERADDRAARPDTAMPFAAEPIACSRMPKWIRRPVASSAVKVPRLLTSMPVLPVRSARPPMNRPGTTSKTAVSTSSLATRVATTVAGLPGRQLLLPAVEPGPRDARFVLVAGFGSLHPHAALRQRRARRRAGPPRGTTASTSSGTKKSSCGRPRISFTFATSSAPSGLPCASAVSVDFGDG